jgi:hypothetical protein
MVAMVSGSHDRPDSPLAAQLTGNGVDQTNTSAVLSISNLAFPATLAHGLNPYEVLLIWIGAH